MIGICPLLYLGYKLARKTRIYRPEEVDLVKNLDEIEEYERSYVPSRPR